MIPDAFMAMLTGVFTAIMSLIPDWSLPTDITSAGDDLGRAAHFANAYVPLGDCIIMLGIGLGFAAAMGSFHLAMWIWHNVPVFGGSE